MAAGGASFRTTKAFDAWPELFHDDVRLPLPLVLCCALCAVPLVLSCAVRCCAPRPLTCSRVALQVRTVVIEAIGRREQWNLVLCDATGAGSVDDYLRALKARPSCPAPDPALSRA